MLLKHHIMHRIVPNSSHPAQNTNSAEVGKPWFVPYVSAKCSREKTGLQIRASIIPQIGFFWNHMYILDEIKSLF